MVVQDLYDRKIRDLFLKKNIVQKVNLKLTKYNLQ